MSTTERGQAASTTAPATLAARSQPFRSLSRQAVAAVAAVAAGRAPRSGHEAGAPAGLRTRRRHRPVTSCDPGLWWWRLRTTGDARGSWCGAPPRLAPAQPPEASGEGVQEWRYVYLPSSLTDSLVRYGILFPQNFKALLQLLLDSEEADPLRVTFFSLEAYKIIFIFLVF